MICITIFAYSGTCVSSFGVISIFHTWLWEFYSWDVLFLCWISVLCRYLSLKQASNRMYLLPLREENVHLHCLQILYWDRLTPLNVGLWENSTNTVLGMISLHKASQDLLASGWSSEWCHSYMMELLGPGESFSTHLSLSKSACCRFERRWIPVFIIIDFLIKKCSLFQLN